MPTAHNSAQKGDFAKTVLMPGDPKRAKFIAEQYLENIKDQLFDYKIFCFENRFPMLNTCQRISC